MITTIISDHEDDDETGSADKINAKCDDGMRLSETSSSL